MIIQSSYSNTPVWKDIHVHSELPAQLRPLEEITQNLWWVWNEEVKAILETLDPDEWEKKAAKTRLRCCRIYNPISLRMW